MLRSDLRPKLFVTSGSRQVIIAVFPIATDLEGVVSIVVYNPLLAFPFHMEIRQDYAPPWNRVPWLVLRGCSGQVSLLPETLNAVDFGTSDDSFKTPFHAGPFSAFVVEFRKVNRPCRSPISLIVLNAIM